MPTTNPRGLKTKLVASLSALTLAVGLPVAANAQDTPSTAAVPTTAAAPATDAPATSPAAAPSPSGAPSQVNPAATIPTTSPAFVLPNSSENTTIQKLAQTFWKIVNAVGFVFFKGPLSSGLLGTNPQEPHNIDPRFPGGQQVIVPSMIDLNGAIPDPGWFKTDAKLQAAGAQYISAYSTAMGRDIPLIWVPAPDQSTPRPVVYALDGIGGGVWGSYVKGTDMIQRANELNLNIVMPAQGANSNYLDWYDDSGVTSGKQQWETFLTKELPVPLEDAIGASHQRSLTGMSMAGGAVLIFAEHNPGLYDALGVVSGCGESNSAIARFAQQQVLKDLGTTDDLYGPLGEEFGMYNDSLVNASALRGQDNIYVFNAGGLLGPQDFDPNYSPDTTEQWLARTFNGALIEFVTSACTHRMESSLAGNGIPATFEYAAAGAHSWGVFNQGLNGFMDMLGERVYPKQ